MLQSRLEKQAFQVVNECQKLTQFTQYQQINIDSLFETMWSIFDKQKLPTNELQSRLEKQAFQAEVDYDETLPDEELDEERLGVSYLHDCFFEYLLDLELQSRLEKQAFQVK